jgi:chromosome segregation ATPase
MDAADVLYGVSMGRGGVTKVVSRRFEQEQTALAGAAEAA